MNTQEFAEASHTFAQISKLYTQKEIANHLGYSPRQIARWKSGESPVPEVAALVLRQMLLNYENMSTDSDFTFIDLFAGIGEMCLGFEAHGEKLRSSMRSMIHERRKSWKEKHPYPKARPIWSTQTYKQYEYQVMKLNRYLTG